MRPSIRVVALMEATSVTGPAKNLIEFATRARAVQPSLPSVDLSVIAWERGNPSKPNVFIQAAQSAELTVDVLRERRAFDPAVFGQLREIVKKRNPDIIQTHNYKSHLLVWLSGLWKQIPWIGFHHGHTTTSRKVMLYHQLDRFSLPAAWRVVAVCGQFAEQLRRQGLPMEKILVRHNAVTPFTPPEEEKIKQLRQRYGITETPPVVLSVGRLSREKGHADLLRAMASLKSNHPGATFRLVLVGEGPELENLNRLVGELGLIDNVIFCGQQNDVAGFYAIASVVALPSHSEGSPNVLLEAMAAGLPVSATAVGGVPEIAIHQRNALLVEKEDYTELGEAIASLLQDAALAKRLASQAQQDVLALHTPEVHCQALVNLYQECLQHRG